MSLLPPIIRLGTRGSLLARTQSQSIADLLAAHLPPTTRIELVIITTSGDTQQDRPLIDAGGKGLFVKEIDEQLLAGKIDLAVHSAKDLPMDRPEGLVIAATPPRENPADVWIARDDLTIKQLPPGAKVGTASLRRQAQLLVRRPDLIIVPLRGNIDTRLRKIAEGVDDLAATFLAAAGLNRTHLLPAGAIVLPTEEFIPAAGQGTLAIEARVSDAGLLALLKKIHDPLTAAALEFERAVVKALAGNCLAPLGVCAEPRQKDPGWIVRAIALTPDGKSSARCALMATSSTHQALLDLLPLTLSTLRSRGAADILKLSPLQ